MEAVTILAVGFVCMACFFIGAKVGQTVSKGEEIKTPEVNPIKLYNEHNAKKEAEMERHRQEIILGNIECYDGTAKGQEDVPGR